ncbi:hypothetical protein GHC57_07505 [Roseospira navarrensis]|uniref:LysR substrate-binding domain-containing protein n=1 Tax=Roseospira navarrensis TaxID=140058 RepID=A0A7X1ZDJ5_9PROT|nr:hypothetical protein [Roseospira navarrensis]
MRLSADPRTAHSLLAPVLAEFAALFPEIEIELRLACTLDLITRNETDVSIRHAAAIENDAVGRNLFPLSIGPLSIGPLSIGVVADVNGRLNRTPPRGP